MPIELNNDGLAIHYGPRKKGADAPASPEHDGSVKELILDVDFESLNASVAGTIMGIPYADVPARNDVFPVPAGASIVDMYTQVTVPFVGGTFTAQLVTGAGAAVAGTSTGAVGATTGSANVATAAGVETTVDSYIDAKPSAALTAGKARIIIRYV